MHTVKRVCTLVLTGLLALPMAAPAGAAAASFSDLPSSHWAYIAMTEAAGYGILQGTGANTMSPSAPLTWPQFLAMAARAFAPEEYARSAASGAAWDQAGLDAARSAGLLEGQDAAEIAKAAGFDIPADTKVVGLKIDAVGKANVLNKEIMGPIVVLKSYETFEEAVAMAIQNMEEAGGIGHTAGIFSNDRKHVEYYAERIPVARVLVNQPTPDAWGPSTNGLSPAVSESCGTWGNNILCENVDYRHLINISKIALPLDVDVPSAEELFKD